MKKVLGIVMGLGMLLGSFVGLSQSKTDDQRMDQDIEVAENILGTLLRLQSGKRNFFPMEVSGSYMPCIINPLNGPPRGRRKVTP